PSGHLKVLDFGLARLSDAALAEAATIAGDAGLLTSPGAVLGTAPYMSPEQARGEALDARSDIFSFGAVLYEMASGRGAFTRASSAETVSAILKEEPAQMGQLPPELGRVVTRCLEKDADLRYQSAADLRSELKRLKRSSTSGVTAAIPAAKKSTPWRAIAVAAALVVIAGIGYWKLAGSAAPAAPAALRFRQLTFSGDVVDAAISPDGRFLAEVHIDPAGTSLHLLSIANGSDVEIVPPGNGCCQDPTIAPDDSAVYFVANGTLESVPVLGGAVRAVVGSVCSGAGFSPDGSRIAYIVRFGNTLTRLMTAAPDGSQAREVSQSTPGTDYDGLCWTDDFNPGAPAWSPDGRELAIAIGTLAGNGLPGVGVIPAAGGKATLLAAGVFNGISNIAWLPGGHGLVASAPSAYGGPSEIWRLAWPGGERTQLTSDLQGYSNVTAAAGGALALLHSNPQASVWVQAKAGGDFTQLPGGGTDQDGFGGVAWTPAGKLLSVRDFSGNFQLWIEDADGSQARALTLTGVPHTVFAPAVAPNGQIFVSAQEQGQFRIWRADADGSHAEALTAPNGAAGSVALIRNGSEVAYIHEDSKGNQEIWEVPVAGGPTQPLWKGFVGYNANNASPDGKRLLEASRPSYVLLQIGDDGKVVQVTPLKLDSKTMLSYYRWTPDGRAITYIHRQGSVDNIWAFPLNGAKPYALTHFTSLGISGYGYSRDQRLAVSRGSQNTDVILATGLGKSKK
ncbi:MAG: protein kinase domain-containing protein, partial [Terriglobales bacterium]